MYRKVSIFFVSSLVLIICVSCQSADWDLTGFKPIKLTEKYRIFEYSTFASVEYPLNSEEADKTRMEWLERHLRINGYSTDNYEILSRRQVKSGEHLLGDTYGIWYKVRVPKKSDND
jgi:hypothetical protein